MFCGFVSVLSAVSGLQEKAPQLKQGKSYLTWL